jgi:hypothetical protein
VEEKAIPFPIRFKLTHRQTGKSFKQWAKDTGKSDAGRQHFPSNKVGMMPCINEDGNVYVVEFEGFYLGGEFLSPKDWELKIATEKDANGQWQYRRFGY